MICNLMLTDGLSVWLVCWSGIAYWTACGILLLSGTQEQF